MCTARSAASSLDVCMGSHKVAGKGYIFTKTSQMASIGVIFTSTYHTKQLNPWPNSSPSRVVNYSQLSACQGYMKPSEGDLYTHGCLTSLRNKPQQSSPGNFQHQYLAELFVNMYSYCLMVKSVSCWKPPFLRFGHIFPPSYIIVTIFNMHTMAWMASTV